MSKLIAENIKKQYEKRQIVSGVSLTVEQGSVIGLLGPNGAGKTTCFYILVGLIKPDSGKIFVNNKEITHLPIHERAKVGLNYLPQEASVFRKLSVSDNIQAVLELRKNLTKKERTETLTKLLNEFNISHISNTLGMRLSGGERRRVEIARTIALNPSFILLDEPFAGVDPISINDIKEIITIIKNREIGILITDHNVRETLDICDHAYIMSEGIIIAEGEPKNIMENAKVRKVYLGDNFSL